MYFDQYDKFTAGWIPTQEELLDINFNAIVSDCRGLISGTLIPRSWADISGTWSTDYVKTDRPIKRACVHAGPVGPTRTHKLRGEAYPPVRVRLTLSGRRMARVFVANGMTTHDAREKARKLQVELGL